MADWRHHNTCQHAACDYETSKKDTYQIELFRLKLHYYCFLELKKYIPGVYILTSVSYDI